MNYFEFYGMPVSFLVNEDEVREKYIELSRKYHPDFFASETEGKQQEVLQLSTLNTKAFHTLSDFDRRMKYILEIKNLIHEGERYSLPQNFLMDMMEINEALMEIKMAPDMSRIAEVESQINSTLDTMNREIAPVLWDYNDNVSAPEVLAKIKDYYYKKKYLLRIKESLDTFGDSQ